MDKLKKMEKYQGGLPSIFVIDEAKGLKFKRPEEMEKNIIGNFLILNVNTGTSIPVSNRGPYNVFRRVFRMFKNTWERLFLIVISTSGQISVLFPDLELRSFQT